MISMNVGIIILVLIVVFFVFAYRELSTCKSIATSIKNDIEHTKENMKKSIQSQMDSCMKRVEKLNYDNIEHLQLINHLNSSPITKKLCYYTEGEGGDCDGDDEDNCDNNNFFRGYSQDDSNYFISGPTNGAERDTQMYTLDGTKKSKDNLAEIPNYDFSVMGGATCSPVFTCSTIGATLVKPTTDSIHDENYNKKNDKATILAEGGKRQKKIENKSTNTSTNTNTSSVKSNNLSNTSSFQFSARSNNVSNTSTYHSSKGRTTIVPKLKKLINVELISNNNATQKSEESEKSKESKESKESVKSNSSQKNRSNNITTNELDPKEHLLSEANESTFSKEEVNEPSLGKEEVNESILNKVDKKLEVSEEKSKGSSRKSSKKSNGSNNSETKSIKIETKAVTPKNKLKPISHYELKELKELAGKHKILQSKMVNGKRKLLTKQELYNSLKKYSKTNNI